MMGRTHILIGSMAAFAVARIPGMEHFAEPGMIAVTSLGALIPDADDPRSWIGRKMPVVSEALSLSGHRGFTHTLACAIGASLLLLYAAMSYESAKSWVLAFLLGYLSHLLADLNSSSGVPIAWPFGDGKIKAPWAIRTGGVLEWIFSLLCLPALLYMALVK